MWLSNRFMLRMTDNLLIEPSFEEAGKVGRRVRSCVNHRITYARLRKERVKFLNP